MSLTESLGETYAKMSRQLPGFKGKLRLGRWLMNALLDPAEPRLIKLPSGVCLEVPNLIENLSLELFLNGHYEQDLVDFLVKQIPPGGTLVDVGANIGVITVSVAASRPDISVIAIEASGKLADYLQRNVERNQLKNVQVEHKAVYSEDDQVLDFYSPDEKFGKGSLASVFTDRKESVKTIRLDRYIRRNNLAPSYIKIDVEGFEFHVMESLSGILTEPGKPVIIFEFVDWAEQASSAPFVGAAQRRLLDFGYILFDFEKYCRGIQRAVHEPQLQGSGEFIGFPTESVIL